MQPPKIPPWLSMILVIVAGVFSSLLLSNTFLPGSKAYTAFTAINAALTTLLGVLGMPPGAARTATLTITQTSDEAVTKPIKVPPALPPALLLLFLGASLSACACYTASNPAYNSKQCVVARASVNCGVSGVGGALAGVLQNLPADTQESILAQLESSGESTAACILIDTATSLIGGAGKATISKPSALYSSVSTHLDRWRAANGARNVKFCFAGKGCQ